MSIPTNGSDVPSWDTIADHLGQVVDPFTGLDGLAELSGGQSVPPQCGNRSAQQRSALADAARLLVEGLGAVPTALQSCGVTDADRSRLTAHLGRVALQGCPTRDFKAAWRKNAEGQSVPKMYRVGHPSLNRMQYVALTHAQYAAVIVVDVDRRGTDGGGVDNIHPEAYRVLLQSWYQSVRIGAHGHLLR